MQNTSPFVAMQRVETQIKIVLRGLDTDTFDGEQRKVVVTLKRLIVDTRLDIRDYELSETRDEQLKNAAEAKKRVAKVQTNILLAGNVFGAADVAQLSAQLEQINGWLL